ncbi:MAG TPA: hypothetical protein PLW02_02475 [Verrucomicrobiota bacterium]|nr:hypothetical protein [Verrucomicrobiota bacterium]
MAGASLLPIALRPSAGMLTPPLGGTDILVCDRKRKFSRRCSQIHKNADYADETDLLD